MAADELPIVIPPKLSLNCIAPSVRLPPVAPKSIATPLEIPCRKLLNRATSVGDPSVGSPVAVTPGTVPTGPPDQLAVLSQLVVPLPCHV